MKKRKLFGKKAIAIEGLEPNCMGDDEYITNCGFKITPEKAEEIIKELQRILKLRKKYARETANALYGLPTADGYNLQ